MNTQSHERLQRLVYLMSCLSVAVFFVLVMCLLGFEVYVRWVINKDFMILGGFELEALTVSSALLILGLLYVYRPTRPDA